MKAKKVFLFFVLLIVSGGFFCKKPEIISFADVLHLGFQWRKTAEAVYNKDNAFEKYTFNFEMAKDCEKNSFIYLGKDGCDIFNLCTNIYLISYTVEIEKDSIRFVPYYYDTIQIGFSRYIDYYDERSFVLRYDTIINGENKIIKESYLAFDMN